MSLILLQKIDADDADSCADSGADADDDNHNLVSLIPLQKIDADDADSCADFGDAGSKANISKYIKCNKCISIDRRATRKQDRQQGKHLPMHQVEIREQEDRTGRKADRSVCIKCTKLR